jgi:probable DNA repair protein
LLRGAAPPAQLLGAGQERAVWESVLAAMSGGNGDEESLVLHAGALMSSAARATQAGLTLAHSAQSEEESLLARALTEVRALCTARGLLSLRRAPAQTLDFLAGVPAPLVTGEPRLTVLQETLARRFWPGVPLLVPVAGLAAPAAPRLIRANDLQQELDACAAWCRNHLQQDAGARLQVLTACTDPPLAIQASLLWRALAPGATGDERLRGAWLAVEGGDPLLHQTLNADALTALELADSTADTQTADLLTLLRSPYFGFGSTAAAAGLATWLGEPGLASFDRAALREALQVAAQRQPAAQSLGHWLDNLHESLATPARLGATEWALRFSAALDGGGFAPAAQLDSRDLQRRQRWHELLDEFAALDAVLPPLALGEALRRLRRLAAQARHQAATGDAAITLSDALADPVASYDGIWVLGLTEGRWPPSPRPDAWVALADQRRAHWPESGVAQRREHALWALQCWQGRSAALVLSYPAREADLAHRPTALPAGAVWQDSVLRTAADAPFGASERAADQQLRPLAAAALSSPLPGGAARLGTQQECPFRAQAQWRLGATPPAMLRDGVPPSVRGRLLHGLLQHLWLELRDHAALLALDGPARDALLERSWTAAVGATRGASWLPQTVLARERSRALALTARVLELERQRAPFTVLERECKVYWHGAGTMLDLRIDRVDQQGADVLLLDYKSGAAGRMGLQESMLQPLQLALYASALAQAGRPVTAAALLNLDPAAPEYAGVAVDTGVLPARLHAVADWPAAQQQWQLQLLQLMTQHLSGDATLTRERKVCARCHLPALCRRAGPEAVEADDE